MGGRDRDRGGKDEQAPDREAWIMSVSDSRLNAYSRMSASAGAASRLDGSPRADGGSYFRSLVDRERERRGLK